MKKILFFSHNQYRDNSPDTVIAQELRKLGNLVWFNTFLQEDGEKVCHIKPDIVVLPEIRVEFAEEFAKQCGYYGIKVVVKMCEFGISEESLPHISDRYKEAIFGRLPLNNIVDRFLAWGPKMREMMIEHMKLDPYKVVSCGAYQFGHYFLPPPPVTMKSGKKKTILFAGGFPYADRNKEYCMPEADASDLSFQTKLVEKDQFHRGKLLDFLPVFAKRYSDDWEILVKPHPGERAEIYQAVLKRFPIKVLDNVCGFASLQGVDFLVHSGSTMGFEAHLKNIPSINIFNNCEDVVVSRVSPNCDTAKDFFRTFNAINKKPLSSTAPADIINKLRGYYGDWDSSACRRTAVAIDNVQIGPTRIPDAWARPTEPKYMTDGVAVRVETWHCSGCRNSYFLVDKIREMVKCPYCGVANVKIQPNPEAKNEQVQKMRNAGHEARPDVERAGSVSSVRKARPKAGCRLGRKTTGALPSVSGS
jgi:surface carbohydrate biosynthesis protein